MKNSACWAIIPSVFLLDRISKIFVTTCWPEGGAFEFIPGFLHLTRVNNTGAAFGLWKNSSFFLTVISVASLIFIVAYTHRLLMETPVRRAVYGWALVAGGALGNLYDRVRFGFVIDFIDLRVWPVFNIADSAICVGVFWILLVFFWKKKIVPGKA